MALLINLASKLKRRTPTTANLLLLHFLRTLSHTPPSPLSSKPVNLSSPSPLSSKPVNLSSPSHKHLFKHRLCTLSFSTNQSIYKTVDFESLVDDETNVSHEPGVVGVVELLRKANGFDSEEEAMASLDESGVQLTQSLVFSAIWVLRNDWELALLAFEWGEKLGCNDARVWDLMVWVLGKQRKFGTAWRLVRDMVRSSMDARRALFIMIESYADANYPSKAIRTFQALEKFRVTQDIKAFYTLLNALCKNGNIEEAEEYMLLNKNFFPLETEGFNIILNGWSNITVDVFEAKRIWREMSNCCITPNATSYTYMISCFSKVGNLFDSLRLYDEMKKRGWIPGLEVYNSLIYVLTRENCLKEAFKVVEKIKEAGLNPDSTTYNSMVFPLCEADKPEEAWSILARMVMEKVKPTIYTYHAFIEGESIEGTVELLKQMKKADCSPNGLTFLLILNRFLKLEQPGDAVRMWAEMLKYEVVPDSAHYTTVVGGLARCGWLAKASKFYDDMKFKGFPDDPKLLELIEEPVGGGQDRRKKGRDTQRRRY